MKKCFKCEVSKPLDDFYLHPKMSDGHLNKCKQCAKTDVNTNRESNLEHYREYDKERQRYSKDRIFQHRYNGMRQRTEGRGSHGYSSEGLPMLSRCEWDKWVIENMDDFNKLYSEWESGGFDPKLCPSIDRIDNNIGYISTNIQWLSKTENSIKGRKQYLTLETEYSKQVEQMKPGEGWKNLLARKGKK